MLRDGFRDEMGVLSGRVSSFGWEVAGNLAAMVEVIETGDVEFAGWKVGEDGRFKRWGKEIEDNCLRFQLLQSPVACDLRFIHTARVIANHIVRSATLCEHVFRAFSEISEERFGGRCGSRLEAVILEMSVGGRDLFENGMNAFVSRSLKATDELVARNERITQLRAEALELAARGDGLYRSPGQIARTALISHYLERIADHGTDMGLRSACLTSRHRRNLLSQQGSWNKLDI
ncbi:phosphate signaling complex PhoU family protein [Rubrobacter indicoceani]|uniref:phosphate signaling complex PhoU family protein n=1 Tax=Rubrobacter indicoceani TaxID=2051957 RepID=UPI000E5C1EEC|nr:PhoU domain-containing protein [Rubrobacter indicoceani]